MCRKLSDVKSHIKTHAERSDDDRAAVSVLKTFLRSNGKINSNFSENDKWPNTDGTFEFVENPCESRSPKQNFVVQIKGSRLYREEHGVVKYTLQSLAFPALISKDVTLDPGILFVVLNPTLRDKERVFWKYISSDFLSTVNFNNNSKIIAFDEADEIKNTADSVALFCERLSKISDHHSFVKKLENTEFTELEIRRIIEICNQELIECIDKGEMQNISRDDLSKKMLRYLEDICKSTMLLHAISTGIESPDLRLALEKCLLERDTKYLVTFIKGLKFLSGRIPESGQSERLMIKYYNFLWQIREHLKYKFNIEVLDNLEKFPLIIDEVDQNYYKILAHAIESVGDNVHNFGFSCYYVQKNYPFFVGNERYYEITLQLSSLYTTKYNRITVYSKESITSAYPLKISYANTSIELFGITSKIKVVTDWQVSVPPTCLNLLAKILRIDLKINRKHSEYISLMNFLTKSGMNLLDFIDLSTEQFEKNIASIYDKVKIRNFKKILTEIHENYNMDSTLSGRYTLRYLLIHLREDALRGVLPDNKSSSKVLKSQLYLSSKCFPFEKNPYIYNLVKRSTNSASSLPDIQSITGLSVFNQYLPYIRLKHLINTSGELYYNLQDVSSNNLIENFNKSLDDHQHKQMHSIIYNNQYITIKSFEHITLSILNKLLKLSIQDNRGQNKLNRKYLKEHDEIDDSQKKHALSKIFVNSQVALIYGAAGTGKTMLINNISSMMRNKKKLFLTKTHTALQNLRRRIANPGLEADFDSIDKFTKRYVPENYDLIFIDECSIIDNDIFLKFMEQISENTFLVLAGDVLQIESIKFGNWFSYAKHILPSSDCNFELLRTWRTENPKLIELWDAVRTKSSIITEKLAINGDFSEEIGECIFRAIQSDEVVLCLNYDGKFGLNNINQYFQNANINNELVSWGDWGYKENDPILFHDNQRFKLLHNNLKGRIFKIFKTDRYIDFTIDVNIILTKADCRQDNIELVDVLEDVTRIKFRVNTDNDSEDLDPTERVTTVVPFQISYALSIHKAQGLEFDSVKIIIPSSNSEYISHGVFYTAITRARKNLKIYWSGESMHSIIAGFNEEDCEKRSLDIIRKKLEQKR